MATHCPATESMRPPRPRLPLLLWLSSLVVFAAVVLVPISNRLTRAGGVLLLFVIWCGLIGLCWHRRSIRFSLLGVSLLAVGFMVLPARSLPDANALRSDYIAGLRRYDGATYFWGGENALGIDCSGLIRRGLIDSLFLRGMRTFDAGLVRRAFSLWWHDCTAEALGDAGGGLTVPVVTTPSINRLDHTKILPGDLAVTSSVVRRK